MTTPTTGSPRRRHTTAKKKKFWSADLSSLGKGSADSDDDVEHPPYVPILPRVNLLPPRVRESIALAKIRRGFILVGLLLVAAVAGVWFLQASQISSAESAVATAKTENARLQDSMKALQPVKEMYDQITRLQDVVTTTLASQPQAAPVIRHLLAAGEAVGAGGGAVRFPSFEVAYTGIPVNGGDLNACPNPDPFNEEITIGCLTFSAGAANRAQVSNLLRLLEEDPLFTGPFVTSTSYSDAADPGYEVAFTGSVGIALDALRTELTQEQIDAILAPPMPEPSASPSASAGGAQ